MPITFTLDTIEEAAAEVLAAFAAERVIAVNGQMGAGKTTFITALCRHLGITGHASSPTYSLMNHYETESGEPVYHIDLYRLRDAEEARAAGIEEALYSGARCFVEWPAVAPEIFPANSLYVNINILSGGVRQLEFSRMA